MNTTYMYNRYRCVIIHYSVSRHTDNMDRTDFKNKAILKQKTKSYLISLMELNIGPEHDLWPHLKVQLNYPCQKLKCWTRVGQLVVPALKTGYHQTHQDPSSSGHKRQTVSRDGCSRTASDSNFHQLQRSVHKATWDVTVHANQA